MLQRTEENECILVIQSTSIVCESLRMKKSQISIQMELLSVKRGKKNLMGARNNKICPGVH